MTNSSRASPAATDDGVVTVAEVALTEVVAALRNRIDPVGGTVVLVVVDVVVLVELVVVEVELVVLLLVVVDDVELVVVLLLVVVLVLVVVVDPGSPGRKTEWAEPLCAATMPVMASLTGEVRVVVVPSPSWPSVFWPHAHTSPEAVRAKDWSRPSPTSTAAGTPGTTVGEVRTDVLPSPSCPR